MVDSVTLSKIRSYFRENREGMIRDLSRLMRIPSVRSTPAPDAPFGVACRDALFDAVALFRENGFDAETRSGNCYGIARYGAGEPVICYLAHTDVVPVGEGWDYTEPFTPLERDGCLIGRGCSDDKGGVIMALYLLRAFRDLNLPMKGTLQVFFGASEETGMEDVEAFVKEMPMPTVSIIPDGEYPVSLGEKGICHAFVESKEKLTDVLDFSGGLAFNLVLDKVDVTVRGNSPLSTSLEKAISGNSAFSCRRKGGNLILTATGVTAHASIPETSVNAAKLACDLLLSLPELGETDRRILAGASALLNGVHGEPFGISCEDAYFGPVTSANGIVSANDGRLRLSFDIRYGSSVQKDYVDEQIRSTLDLVGWSLVRLHNEEGFRLPEELPFVRSMVDTYRFVMGDQSLQPIYMGGGTYARHLKNAFSIGTVLPGYPILPMREGHGGWHQPDEAINVEGFLGSAVMMTCMTVSLLETL